MSCKPQSVKVRRVHEAAKLPVYGSVGAAAADVHTISNVAVTIEPGRAVLFDTGLQFEIPVGYELKAYSRSGHGFKHGIRLSNCTGILDSDYRGNLMVSLYNDSDKPYVVEPFERVCQVQVCKAVQHQFYDAQELTETVRGTGGFGSTGRANLLNKVIGAPYGTGTA